MKYTWMLIVSLLLQGETFADETPLCYTYDAVRILGIGTPDAKPLIGPKPGEIIIRYGGWSAMELAECKAVKRYLQGSNSEQLFRDVNPESTTDKWYRQSEPPGTYRLRLVLPKTKRQSYDDQMKSKEEGETPVPVVLAATALIVHRIEEDKTLLVADNARYFDKKSSPHVNVIRCGTPFEDPTSKRVFLTKTIGWDPIFYPKSLSVGQDSVSAERFDQGIGFAKQLD
jgi:hypothetical protein